MAEISRTEATALDLMKNKADFLLEHLKPITVSTNAILRNRNHRVPKVLFPLDTERQFLWPITEVDVVENRLRTFRAFRAGLETARDRLTIDPKASIELLSSFYLAQVRVFETLEDLCVSILDYYNNAQRIVDRLVERQKCEKSNLAKPVDAANIEEMNEEQKKKAADSRAAMELAVGYQGHIAPENFLPSSRTKGGIRAIETSARLIHVHMSNARGAILHNVEELKLNNITLNETTIGRLRDLIKDMSATPTTITDSQRRALRNKSIDWYDAEQASPEYLQKSGKGVWCPITQKIWPSNLVDCGHIIKAQSARQAAHIMGISESLGPAIVNVEWNTVLWREEIEMAWTRGQIAIVPWGTIAPQADTPWEYRLALIDRSIENRPWMGADNALKIYTTWGELSRRRIDFKYTKHRPCASYLYVQSVINLLHAKQRGYDRWHEFEEECIRDSLWISLGKDLDKSMIARIAYSFGLPKLSLWTEANKTWQQKIKRHTKLLLAKAADPSKERADADKERTAISIIVAKILDQPGDTEMLPANEEEDLERRQVYSEDEDEEDVNQESDMDIDMSDSATGIVIRENNAEAADEEPISLPTLSTSVAGAIAMFARKVSPRFMASTSASSADPCTIPIRKRSPPPDGAIRNPKNKRQA